MKESIRQLVAKGYLLNNPNEAKELEVSAHYELNNSHIEYCDADNNVDNEFEDILHIDICEDGTIMIITKQGLEHVGEYEVSSKDTLIECNIYLKVEG